MIFRSVFVNAIIVVCLSAPDASNEINSNHATYNEALSTVVNSTESHDKYISILKDKCEKDKHLLTSYGIQCCLKMANASDFAPFSIINQNTNVIQFKNVIDKSLFEILLRQLFNKHGGDVSKNDTFDTGYIATAAGKRDLAQCLKAKALCSQDFTKSSLICQQNIEKQDEKIKSLRTAVEQQTAISLERENHVHIFEEQREADRKVIHKLTKQLESTVIRLRREEKNTMHLTVKHKRLATKLRGVAKDLSTCSSSLALARQRVVIEQSFSASCTAELTELQTEHKFVAAMKEELSTLRTENVELREGLKDSRKMVTDKDIQLEMCAQLEPKLMRCKAQLGHCRSNSSETKQHWRDEYDDCSGELSMTKTLLSKANSSVTAMQSVVFQLKKEGDECRVKYDLKKNESDFLLRQSNSFRKTMTVMENNEKTQLIKIASLEEQSESCTKNKELIQGSLLSLKHDLLKQLESNNVLRTRHHEQSSKTMFEMIAKERCQKRIKAIESDYNDCQHSREEEMAELKNITVQADQCSADYSNCNNQLIIARSQSQKCSSQSTAADEWKAEWEVIHQQCKDMRQECETSKTIIFSQFTILKKQEGNCQRKLTGLREDEARCQATNSQLSTSLKDTSDAHNDAETQLRALTRQETACRLALTDARQATLVCSSSTADHQRARDQYLEEVKQLAERVGSLEASNADLNASLSGMSKQHEDCDRGRRAASAAASSLNFTVKSCHRTLKSVYVEINTYKFKINKCLHVRNVTLANMTEWQELHKRCELNAQEAEQQQQVLVKQCDAERLDSVELQQRIGNCEKQLQDIRTVRKAMRVEINNYRRSLTTVNATAMECAVQLEHKSAAVLNQETAHTETTELLSECTGVLILCQNPPRACPEPVGSNSYWDVNRTKWDVDSAIGKDKVVSAEALEGCAMASRDNKDGSVMRHFCRKQHGHLFKVANQAEVAFAHQFVHFREGRYLVEPSAYFANSLNFDLKKYASDEEVCYYIERTITSTPKLRHAKCKGHVFSAMCWAAYEHDSSPDDVDNGAGPPQHDDEDVQLYDYVDYTEVLVTSGHSSETVYSNVAENHKVVTYYVEYDD